jgi:hypothetical protein
MLGRLRMRLLFVVGRLSLLLDSSTLRLPSWPGLNMFARPTASRLQRNRQEVRKAD